jgi:ankyrin repeat protein
MSVNMRESLEQTLTENPNRLHETDDHGYSFLHQLSLAGSLDGVDVCLKLGADPNKPASNGMTPFALAKCLGWKKVMARLQQAGAGQGK